MRAAFVLSMFLLLPVAGSGEVLRFEFAGVVTGTPTGLFAGANPGDPVSSNLGWPASWVPASRSMPGPFFVRYRRAGHRRLRAGGNCRHAPGGARRTAALAGQPVSRCGGQPLGRNL